MGFLGAAAFLLLLLVATGGEKKETKQPKRPGVIDVPKAPKGSVIVDVVIDDPNVNIIDVTQPPAGSTPVEVPKKPPTTGPSPKPPKDVKEAPPGSTPLPPGAAQHVPLHVPDPTSQAGQVALMLYESAPRGPVKSPGMLGAYKSATGVLGKPELYGRGTAQSLMARGIVPPVPWDWVKPADADKAQMAREFSAMAKSDPSRATEWNKRASEVFS